MSIFRLIFFATAMTAVTTQTSTAAADVPTSKLAILVEACKAEAISSHFRRVATNTSAVSAHQTRMKQVCDEWVTVAPENRPSLMSRCKAEASTAIGGARRGNFKTIHAVRHRKLCEALAQAVEESAK